MVGFVLYQLYILHHSVEIQSHQHLLQAWFTPENYQSPKLFQRGESKGTFQVHGELTVVAEPCSAWFSLRLRAWIHGWWRELCCFRLRTFGGSLRLRVAVNHEFQWSSDSFNTCKVTCSSWKHKLGANGGNLVSNLAAQKGMCLKWDAFKSRLETNLLSIWHFSILGPRGPTCETRCMKHFHELSWLNVQTQRQTCIFEEVQVSVLSWQGPLWQMERQPCLPWGRDAKLKRNCGMGKCDHNMKPNDHKINQGKLCFDHLSS